VRRYLQFELPEGAKEFSEPPKFLDEKVSSKKMVKRMSFK
jgi:hypothetical protein